MPADKTTSGVRPEQCGNCYWWWPKNPGDGSAECHRRCPSLLHVGTDIPHWPVLSRDNGCGDFQKK